MKKATIILTAVLALGILFDGCKKKNETPTNQMTYDGIEYALSHGIIFTFDNEGYDVYDYDLLLLSPGIIVHDNDSISGIGHGIVFELYSNDSINISSGDYIYDDSGEDHAGTCGYADAVFNYNVQTGEGLDIEAIAGKVTVKVTGNEYEVSIDLTMTGGKTLTGFYKGTLKHIPVDTKSSREF